MIPHWLIDARVIRALSKGLVGSSVVCGVCVLLCLGRLYWSSTRVNSLTASAKAARLEATQVEDQIKQARGIGKSNTPDATRAVAAFQSTAFSGARKHGAELGEITIEPDAQPYLSKYTNDPPPQGWKQVGVRMTLSGRIQDLLATLDELKLADLLFELDLLDVSRTSINPKTGETTVTAQVQLRVLMRTNGV